MQGRFCTEPGGEWMDGQRLLLDLCIHCGGAAEVSQVGRKAVADIDACGGNASTQKGLADVETWFGKHVRMVFGGFYAGDTFSSAKHSG